MKIGINASFIRKPDSGMGQVSRHFLSALFEMAKEGSLDEDLEFVLYLEKDEELDLPNNFTKNIFLPWYKRDDLIRKIFWEKFLLPKKIKQDDCDVFFSLYQSTTKTSTPHLMLVHDAIWKKFPQYINNIRKRIYYRMVDCAIKKADKVMTISEFSKKDILNFFGVQEKDVFVNGIDCDPIFKKEFSRQEVEDFLKKENLEKGYIFYVGGFDVRKNVAKLIDAYGLLWKKHNQEVKIPKLVLAGKFHPHLVPLVTDIPGRIRKANEFYGVPEKNFELIGFAEQEKLPLLYKGASMLCYPSLQEGFGLPVLEAMNSGCAVVSSNVSSIPEVTGSDSAWLVDPKNSEEIAQAIFEALTDNQKKENFIQKSKERANEFDWDTFTEKTLKTINETAK